MKFNPHLHIIINSNIDFNFKFNKLWRRIILSNLKLTSNQHYYGYYVWSDKQIIKSKLIAKYIGRYVRHPIIANGRIVNYGKKEIVFSYEDSRKNKILIRKSINDFITSLIQHIPPQQFKVVRYYGAYSRNQRRKYVKYFN